MKKIFFAFIPKTLFMRTYLKNNKKIKN